jgi:hypothetical protein
MMAVKCIRKIKPRENLEIVSDDDDNDDVKKKSLHQKRNNKKVISFK